MAASGYHLELVCASKTSQCAWAWQWGQRLTSRYASRAEGTADQRQQESRAIWIIAARIPAEKVSFCRRRAARGGVGVAWVVCAADGGVFVGVIDVVSSSGKPGAAAGDLSPSHTWPVRAERLKREERQRVVHRRPPRPVRLAGFAARHPDGVAQRLTAEFQFCAEVDGGIHGASDHWDLVRLTRPLRLWHVTTVEVDERFNVRLRVGRLRRWRS